MDTVINRVDAFRELKIKSHLRRFHEATEVNDKPAARKAWAALGREIGKRSPEMVRKMEIERGIYRGKGFR